LPTTRTRMLVTEMSHAREDHGRPARVRRPDHVLVARAAARLDDGGGAGGERLLETVGERKEGVAAEHGPAERDAEALGPRARDTDRLDARGLAAAEREGPVGGGENDRVRFDVLDNA